MGRLFWKFFLFFWLAQIVTVFFVGVAIRLLESESGPSVANMPPDTAEADLFRPLTPPVPPGFDRNIGADSQPSRLTDGAGGEIPPQIPPPGRGFPGAGSPPADFAQFPPGFPGEAIGSPPPNRVERRFAPPLPPLIAGSVVSLLFALLLARYFFLPIRNLQRAFKSVANGKLDIRVGQDMGRRRDELADLGSGFDSMAERLQELVEGKQRLLHDVSHELRSPLARMQAAIDLMQQQPERNTEFIERIERESGRIDRLVGELLTLARLDGGINDIHMEFVDLKEMIEIIAEDAAFEAESKSCQVVLTLPQKVSMQGNPDLLHRAIENIVRNAIRYSPDAGQVTINGKLTEDHQSFSLIIADQGKGVAESDLELIFEPFYRSPTADRFQGYGIGMALTRRVIEAHQGRVFAANRRQGGLRVTIVLPLVINSEDL
jgi:signal transduction histidine kinase